MSTPRARQLKKGESLREWQQLIQVISHFDPAGNPASELQPISWADRCFIVMILGAVAIGEDVAARYYKPNSGRPATKTDRNFWLTVDYLLRRSSKERSAGKIVMQHWGLKRADEVADIVRKFRNESSEMIKSLGVDCMRKLCELQLQREQEKSEGTK